MRTIKTIRIRRTTETVKYDPNYTIDLAGIIENEKEIEYEKSGLIKYSLFDKIYFYHPLIMKLSIFVTLFFMILSIIGIYNTYAYELQDPSLYNNRVDFPTIIGCINSRTLETKDTTKEGNCLHGKNWQNITVRDWSLEIYERNHVNPTHMLDMLAINSIECAHPLGMCDGGSIGPFQINFIHKEEYEFAKSILDQPTPGGAEDLYERQMNWTLARFEHQEEKGYCKTVKDNNEQRFKCLARFHNGNNRIDWNGKKLKVNYANKGWIVRGFIKQFLKDKNLID